jgi:hypothetical protein
MNTLVSKPLSFYVKGSECPPRSGDLEKAAILAGNLLKRAGR